MKKLTLFALLFLFITNDKVEAQTTKAEYLTRIAIIHSNINKSLRVESKGLYLENLGKHEKPYSYLWPLCALI